MKVLSIDKNPDEKMFMEPIMENLEHDYKTCESLTEGLKTFSSWQPDLVLLDLDFPEKAPLDLLSEFEKKSGFSHPPVITFALEPTEELIAKAYELGTSDFIYKPFDLSELVIRVKNLLTSVAFEKENLKIISTLKTSKLKLNKDKELFSSYFSKDLMNNLLEGNISTSLGGEIKDVSALFCHLRDSERLLKDLKASDFSDLLSALFSGISDIINEEKGSVNKYLGDGILATFGCPNDLKDNALASVKAALKIREFLEAFNAFRPKYISEPIKLGMGISKGNVFAGNIGSVNRMEYTVLGDPVNTAARLQYLSDTSQFDIFFDGRIRKEIKQNVNVVRICIDNIRGKSKKVKIYYPKELAILQNEK